MTCICNHCGAEFERRSRKGPPPLYCSDACRQANHRNAHASRPICSGCNRPMPAKISAD